MILFIDTSSDNAILALKTTRGELVDKLEWTSHRNQSEELLLQIDRLLNKNNLTKNDLRKICVNNGPGSYTGVRVGVTVANFLAYAKNIPVVPQKQELAKADTFSSPVIPFYERPPHITTPKKKAH